MNQITFRSDLRKAEPIEDKRLSMRAVREAQNSLEATFANVRGGPEGLTVAEAVERLGREGRNEVAHDRPPHWLLQLAGCFNNPFILVLVALAVIQFVSSPDELKPVIIVAVMVGVSVALRFWQEFRSARAADRLKAMVRTTATVLRRGWDEGEATPREIDMRDLVAGDVIRLSAGDMVPADVRLITSRDLFISQAVLTGESIPIEKYDTSGHVAAKSAQLPAVDPADVLDLPNICFMGTNVVSGTATAIVVATGRRTYFGSLARSIVGQRAQTSFDRGVNSVSWLLIRFMLVMVPVVFAINGFTKGDWSEALLFAISVAVGLTPEMLPMIVSANLSKGAVAMARRKVVVKRLNAIQNLGAMDVLCTDKTGTLTQDRVILEHHLDVHGRDDEAVLRLAFLNSHHQSGMKNLMDQAVLRFMAEKGRGCDATLYRKIDELPFDFVRRRLSIVVETLKREHLMIAKGAVEEMLAVSSHVRDGDAVVPLDDARRAALLGLARAQNADGFRVLIVATRLLVAGDVKQLYANADERDLTIEGFLTFLDPPKETAGPAIAALRGNGVAVKILTGDNAVVSSKICRDVGLEPGEPLLGRDVEKLDEPALRAAVEAHAVFAKMSPLQKARVVRALQANGHTVGFLGDGINDAPALRDADVGISVDTGADIAKESADIILLEKSLMVLEEGIIKGRETFGNIIKYIKMTASSNFGNVFSVLVASAFLPFLPMLALHLLIQNLCYDISQLSLPWDRMDREFLREPRKWAAGDIGRFMICIGPISSIFDISTYCLMWFVFAANAPEHQSLFQSGWFIEGLLSQTLIVHMIRTQKIPFAQSTAAWPVLLLTGAIMAFGIYLPFSPIGAAVGLQPLPPAYFPWLVATLAGYCVLTQIVKTLYIRHFKTWL
ncbi:magnesium-translocating P-type ATPase [Phreatobacter sp. AB_2022a]|uniref:magnesium-translocating P-type ATPase n=1 Tax=Phreatobacter sp. AB_2022a TaxID=3003134 RepID=UPI0022876082|nr:magnesium-translocating P-type ATPase [Phreatobacter sp. AB_2022a]MCZ0735862.1 magnesium-translocating P-type ATPase [Phreatobacter sp. AB_2022a]